MKRTIFYLLTTIVILVGAFALSACNETHTNHKFTQQVISDEYLENEATCTKKATYFYSCICGEKGIDTFEYGNFAEHIYKNNRCQKCNSEQPFSDGLEYKLSSDKVSYSIVGMGTCEDTQIRIPETYNGHPVVAIYEFGRNAISRKVTSISIPDGVKFIGRDAFMGFVHLVDINIPKTVISIGEGAFTGCESMLQLVIPEGITTIESYTFDSCESLTKISIPKSVTSIGRDAFRNCFSLKGVYIDDVESWCNIDFKAEGTNPLHYAHELYLNGQPVVTLTIPETVTTIKNFVFDGCESLISVEIPSTVTTIERNAFYNCDKVTFYCEPDNAPSTWVYNWNMFRPIIWNYKNNDCDSNGNIFTTIGNLRFSIQNDHAILIKQSSTLSGDVVIPNIVSYKGNDYTVDHIDNWAMANCKRLTSIRIPSSVSVVGEFAFYGCDSLTLYLESRAVPIGFMEGWNKSNCPIVLDCANNDKDENGYSYAVVDGIRYSLYNNYAIVARQPQSYVEAVTIPNKIIYNQIEYPVTGISESAFYDFVMLERVVISDGIASIGHGAFIGCVSLTDISIPNSVTSMDGWIFNGCHNLNKITIPNGITSIGDITFYRCYNLTDIIIGNEVASIGEQAFAKCYNLTNITIPQSVTTIYDNVFAGCSSLSSISYVGTKKQWEEIYKENFWRNESEIKTVHCTDGDITF